MTLSRLFAWAPSRTPDDPYWERFMSAEPADPSNNRGPALRELIGQGKVYPVKTVAKPSAASEKIRIFAEFIGAAVVGVASLEGLDVTQEDESLPYSILIGVEEQADPGLAGIGGQWPSILIASINFQVASYVRELGYRTVTGGVPADTVAASCGLTGSGSGQRRLFARRTARYRFGDVIRTDLPLAPDDPTKAPG